LVSRRRGGQGDCKGDEALARTGPDLRGVGDRISPHWK
jgi:hypothetical protein